MRGVHFIQSSAEIINNAAERLFLVQSATILNCFSCHQQYILLIKQNIFYQKNIWLKITKISPKLTAARNQLSLYILHGEGSWNQEERLRNSGSCTQIVAKPAETGSPLANNGGGEERGVWGICLNIFHNNGSNFFLIYYF